MEWHRQCRLLLWLTAAAVLCAAGLTAAARMRDRAAEVPETPSAVTVNDMPVSDVLAVVLQNGSGTISLINRPDGIVADGAPEDAVYSQTSFATLVYSLSHLQAAEALEPGANPLDHYGLETPSAQVSLLTRDDTVRLYLGRKAPLSELYYLQKEGSDGLFLISGESAGLLLQSVDDLRDLSLFPTLSSERMDTLEQIVLQNPAGRIVLRQLQTDTVSRFYGMLEPIATPLNWRTVNDELLEPLRMFAPEHFVSDDVPLADYGLDAPEHILELTLDGETYRCGFVQKDPDTWYCAQLGGTLVSEVPAELAPFLDLDYLDLIGNNLYTRSVADLSRLSASYAGGSAVLEISGSGEALMSQYGGRQLDAQQTLDFYDRIDAIPAASVLTGDEECAAQPLLTLVYSLRTGTEDILEFYPISDRQCAVFLNGQAEFSTYRTIVNEMIDAFEALAENNSEQ